MLKIKVGVLRGGPSAEYEISLLTGENVLKCLPRDKYETRDILLTRDGLWHENGIPRPPEKIFRNIDVAFNALHGEYGEDGRVQQVLEAHRIPYTGSGILASAVAMKKMLAREMFAARLASLSPRSRVGAGAPEEREKSGLKIPRGILISRDGDIKTKVDEIFRKLNPFWAIKPASRGSSVGVTIARSYPEIVAGLGEAFKYDNKVLAEEHVAGREATCGVLENFREERHYALPVVEIVPPVGRFFDYEAKYNGKTREICPGRFDRETSDKIKAAAILAHQTLGCRHYSRSDFIVSPKRGIFILETNTLPGLTSQSLLPKAAEAVGLSFPRLLDHFVSLAL
ncbi:MAG: D-alanine--D-alanine ligase [bacterium]|nr:D-alanine--D-alanine ligase [bacterium]